MSASTYQQNPSPRRRGSLEDEQEEGSSCKNLPPKMICPSKCLNKLLSGLNLNSRRKLQNFEFHLNWITLPVEILIHPSEIEGMISYLKNYANEMLPRDDCEKQLIDYGLAPIICNNTLAFLTILQRDFAVADDCLTESNRLIDICFNAGTEIVHKDYLKGLFYIVKGLKIVLESHTGLLGDINFQQFLEIAIENFEELPLKSQVAVHASKSFFMKLLNNRRDGMLSYKEIDDLIFLDPNFFEWRIYQYLNARKRRIEVFGRDTPPDPVEIQTIQYAWNLTPYNPFCIAYLCMCMTDVLRSHPVADDKGKGGAWTLSCGQWQFDSEIEVVAWIKDFCTKLLKINPLSIKLNLIIADIFGTLMPYKHRDVFLARECIFKAYRFGSTVSSKANQCLASFVLHHIKSPVSSPIQCEELLERACSLNKRNTDALYQLFLVHMHKPSNVYQKIRILFATHLSNPDLSPVFLQKLVFLKGCFHMMVGESENAILTWLSSYNLEKRLDFSMLLTYSYVFRVYQWCHERINLPYVISETNSYFLSLSSQSTNTSPPSDETIRQTKNGLMEMMQDQYQAMNSDMFYKKNAPEDHSLDQNEESLIKDENFEDDFECRR